MFVQAVAADQKNYIKLPGEPQTSFSKNTKACEGAMVSLMVTHLNVTDGKIVNVDGDADVEAYLSDGGMNAVFDPIYTSFTPYAEDIRCAEKTR